MQVLIKGYSFTLSEPYREGTVLTKGEAQALNALRWENIQNNTRKLVNDALAVLGPGELIPQQELDAIQEKITQYDRGYQFPERHQPRPRQGDIEAEALRVAEEITDGFLAANPDRQDDRDELIREQSQLPHVLEEARTRVAAKRRAMSGGLDSL